MSSHSQRGTQLRVWAAAALLTACGGDELGESDAGGLSGATTVFQPAPGAGSSGTTAGAAVTTTGTGVATTSAATTGGAASTSSPGGPLSGGTTAPGGATAGTTVGTTSGAGATTAGEADGGTSVGGATPITTAADPIIPEVTGECPSFASGSFSFGGLSGEMEVGSKGSGDGSLVFYWHGTNGSAGNFRSPFGGIGAGNIQKITSAGGIIFAVQGETGSGDRSCSGTAVFDGDFSVIDQVVACAVRDHNISPHRIYATGCSAGGLQSGCMATRRNDYVAAVAPNSGGLVGAFGAGLMGSSGHVPSSMTMHGGADDNVGINFGDSSNAFNTLITGEGGFAVDCNHMSGHCRAPAELYSAAIDFLLAHPFGVDPEPYSSGLPANFPSYCEIQ